MQSCILAGGTAVGVSVSVVQQPWEAMALGFTAAILSTLGYRYLKVFIYLYLSTLFSKIYTLNLCSTFFFLFQTHLLIAFECHDTCSVLSTHGLPGLLGWLAQLVLQIKYCDDHTV